MTNEEKQALIERSEQKAKELSKVQFGIMHKDKLDLLIYCQALAALTAQPVKLPNCVDDLHGVGPVMSADEVELAIRTAGYEVQE